MSHRRNLRRPSIVASSIISLIASLTIATPAVAAPGVGQTKTISGVVRNASGSPVAGVSLQYDNVQCVTGADISGAGDDSDTITTSAAGEFSFPAYAGQCYVVASAALFSYKGKSHREVRLAAGTSGIVFTQYAAVTTKVELVGVPAGATVYSLIATNGYVGYSWFPGSSAVTDATGTASFTLPASHRVAFWMNREGDHYAQYIGVGSQMPSHNGGTGTYVVPSTGTTYSLTITPRKSTPIVVTLTNVDVGATVDAFSYARFDASYPSITTTSATSVTLRGIVPGEATISVSGMSGATPGQHYLDRHRGTLRRGARTDAHLLLVRDALCAEFDWLPVHR